MEGWFQTPSFLLFWIMDFKIKTFTDAFNSEFLLGMEQLIQTAKTTRNLQFLLHCRHDVGYSQNEGRPVFLALGYENQTCISVATAKSQNRKRGIWGRYATLTYAFTNWDFRCKGIATQLCKIVLNMTQADRTKSIIASRGGLNLHHRLNHKFWGLSREGKVIVDNPLFTPTPGFFEFAPPQVKNLGGLSHTIDYQTTWELFKNHNQKNFMFRDDPEEYCLGDMKNGDWNYSYCDVEKLYLLKANDKTEMLRWMNTKGTFIEKPPIEELNKLVCFQDMSSDFIWLYAGLPKIGLKFRTSVYKIGEVRPAAIWD